MIKIDWKIYYPLSFLLLLALFFNFFYLQNTSFSIITASLYILLFGLFGGHYLFPRYNFLSKLILGILMMISYLMILGSSFYYLFILSDLVIALILVMAPMFLGLKLVKSPLVIKFDSIDFSFRSILKSILLVIYLLLLFKQYTYVLSKATTLSINSPWQVLSSNIFLLYGLSTLVLILLLFLSKKTINLILLSLHYLFSFSIIILIFKLGFGYDPYLHQASEKLIMDTGTFLPKPFYYIGQYSLVVILAKIFAQSVEFFDKLLVPIIAAISLPTVIYQSLKDNFNVQKNTIFISILLFLLIPFSNFTYTTPQSLANIFVLIIVFLTISFINRHFRNFWALFILALATCFIHPLSGLPIMMFVVLTGLFYGLKTKNLVKSVFKNVIFWIVSGISCFALPIAFWLYNLVSKLDMSSLEQMTGQNLLINLTPNQIFWPRFISIFDLIYLYARNVNLMIVVVSLLGLIFVIYYRQLKNYFIYLLMFFILIINYLIVITYIKFPFLSAFSERIFNLSFYFLLPFFMIGLILFLKTLFNYKHLFKVVLPVFLVIFLSISFYLSYPRVDRYENFHGYSISESHLKIVHYIEENYVHDDYIVLADQSLGASVIKEYGFKKYYNSEFYYSLPTKIKDNVYTDFLDMTKEETDKEKAAINAAEKTDVNMIFVVLNDYWELTDKLIDEHKELASNWVEVDEGRAFIFQYLISD
jgi:hypothetical protein